MKRPTVLYRAARPIRDERGVTIVIVALVMTMLLSAVALAVDIGMLLTARSEAQRAADAAALAGAGALLLAPDDAASARAAAIDFGGRNDIQGESVQILPEDVEVDGAHGLVRARARRVAERGNPVTTWFARIFGVDDVDVAAVAAAAIADASAAACLKPWIIPDGWEDLNADGVYEAGETYDKARTGYGTESGSIFRNEHFPDNVGLDAPYTAYEKDIGRPIRLKAGDPKAAPQPGWFFPWDIPQADGSPPSGANRYRWNIVNCNPSPIRIGDLYMVENGDMKGPTRQGVTELLEKDPHAIWDPVTRSVVNSDFRVSPRVVRTPLFDPSSTIQPGKQPIEISNIIGVFLVGMEGDDVIGRFLYVGGVGGGGAGTATGLKYVRLVE